MQRPGRRVARRLVPREQQPGHLVGDCGRRERRAPALGTLGELRRQAARRLAAPRRRSLQDGLRRRAIELQRTLEGARLRTLQRRELAQEEATSELLQNDLGGGGVRALALLASRRKGAEVMRTRHMAKDVERPAAQRLVYVLLGHFVLTGRARAPQLAQLETLGVHEREERVDRGGREERGDQPALHGPVWAHRQCQQRPGRHGGEGGAV
mmetsp:Transcript_25516/g.85018  ORF Transcript_25516/g.85018 Transcript_25516/m.85018 type:complete len:211 (-) Transcript_25516:46-678(-)